MQHYELMFIIPGAVDVTQVPAMKEQILKNITTLGGTVTSQLDMDRRRFAYRVGQESYGYYHVVQFDCEPAAAPQIDKALRLDNNVMRYLLVLAEPMSEERLKEIVAGEKYKHAKPNTSVAAAKPVVELNATELMYAQAPVSKHEVDVDEDKGKVSIEELDKKLDAILEDTDITAKL